MKKSVSVVMMLMVGMLFLFPTGSYASDVTTVKCEEVVNSSSETDEIENFEIVPFANYLIINNESIHESGTSWDQPSDCHVYRVWVQNTTAEKMKVTIRYPKGWGTDTHTMSVGAHSGQSLVINNAKSGRHVMSFSTASGHLSGSVSVRVSDENL